MLASLPALVCLSDPGCALGSLLGAVFLREASQAGIEPPAPPKSTQCLLFSLPGLFTLCGSDPCTQPNLHSKGPGSNVLEITLVLSNHRETMLASIQPHISHTLCSQMSSFRNLQFSSSSSPRPWVQATPSFQPVLFPLKTPLPLRLCCSQWTLDSGLPSKSTFVSIFMLAVVNSCITSLCTAVLCSIWCPVWGLPLCLLSPLTFILVLCTRSASGQLPVRPWLGRPPMGLKGLRLVTLTTTTHQV